MFATVPADLDPKTKAEYEAYFARYIRPDDDPNHVHCVACNTLLNGALGRWVDFPNRGDGEGGCGNCGYPGRLHHTRLPGGKFSYMLQYHPETVLV